jgi:cytochrome c2
LNTGVEDNLDSSKHKKLISYICFVKWAPYLEFTAVLAVIAVAVIIALNIDSPDIDLPAQDNEVQIQPNLYKAPETYTLSPEKRGFNNGRALFKSNCASCHNPTSDGTGPALKGTVERWKAAGNYKGKTGVQWMRIYIKDWHIPVNAGYKYAINMYKSRPSEMNVFEGVLRDDEIDDIMFYVESSTDVAYPVMVY